MTDNFAAMMKQMLEQGQKMAEAFAPAMEGMDVKGLEKLFPTLPKDWSEAWFGRTLNPEGLDARTRLLVTIAAMVVLGAQNGPQLALTIRQGLTSGATKREVAEVIWQMSMFGGLPAMQKAMEVAQAVFAETAESTGEKNDERG
jgi:4-carboxymuconolactone decarboxylase